jgi:two-component system, LuxR family, response regulator FixJ
MSDSGTVHLVDDDSSFLVASSRLLRFAGLNVRVFSSGTEFLRQVSAGIRGCVVADLEMPEVNGLELQEALARSGNKMPLLFLTGKGDIPTTVRALHSGAVDFLEKCCPKEQLIAAVRLALERDQLQRVARAKQDELRSRFATLTGREKEVLKLVVDGKMNKQIAFALGIRERTVKLHRTAITGKVKVHSVAQLTTLAREACLFEKERE